MIESEKKAANGDSVWRSRQDGTVEINEADVSDAVVSPLSVIGIGLPEGFAEEAEKKAELLERRLSRVEEVLGLSPVS
ncbi:hypothetical protein [Pseudomonas aeruginosa]|uniref:hypothetical protein n=1 Tax=Pseudomonas aeruginosa TaxID=287 RepID=UPI0011C14CE9|nr:hypothetical protein [Pseudomonas aeruginosa]EJH4830435.1 hypothetical protein [Pseudomonas aeruginosa]EKX5105855.1 hypothetical protein [Pseudomonas aeruginosa]EMF0829264.1 hypothetical protein [Pseudomonas aeruginosa]KAB0697746.1 hypothetical protein F6X67_05835 [Pseudomonas aeruginosa]KAB0721426.1 hypothetical protein F7O90_30145 [Pseudomonas aeruginosa]